ncbi:hypothetical protein D3C71_79200 [compost metagenome]
MVELTVIVRSHYFLVKRIQVRAQETVSGFARKFIHWGLDKGRGGKWHHVAQRVYAAATKHGADQRYYSEYRFHINTLPTFKEALKTNFITDAMVEWVEEAIPTPVKVSLPIFPHWAPREQQPEVIEYLMKPPPPRAKFVSLQTGKGKSYTWMVSASQKGVLPVILVRPMYLDKWLIDIRKTFDIAIEDLMVIRGSAQLIALLAMAQAGLMDAKIVLISNKTFQNWIKLYEQLGEDATRDQGYPITPGEFCELLGAGERLIDEVHQDFHLNFKIDLYTHVQGSTSLSATMLADDDFLNKMYEVAYPANSRYEGGAWDKYISAKAVFYKLRQPNKLRCTDPKGRYNHILFEESVMKNDLLCSNYMRLILQIIKGTWLRDYKEGQRLVVFAASIEFCTMLTEFLKSQFPNKDVRRYVGEDPFENLMEPDIRVTTLLSAGTAVDIPNLSTTLLTTGVNSSQSNVQGLGRLRKLEDGTTPEFVYLVCEDISKHIIYHERKRELLKDRTESYKSVFMPEPL